VQLPQTDGHHIHLVTRLTAKGLPVTLDFKLYGLGLMCVEMSLDRADVRAKFLVVPAQIGPLEWTYRETMRLRIARLSRWPAFAQKLIYGLLSPALFYLWYLPQLQQDMDIWEKRSYARYPKPSATEGPLVAYRRWAMQFYPATGKSRADSAATGKIVFHDRPGTHGNFDSARAAMPAYAAENGAGIPEPQLTKSG